MTGLSLATPSIDCQSSSSSSAVILRSQHLVSRGPVSILHWLRDWAETGSDRIFLADLASDAKTNQIRFAQMWEQVLRLASGLRNLGAGPSAPVAILSRNSIEHALVSLASMVIGAPVAPISVAYSLGAGDHRRLREVMAQLQPKVLFADNASQFSKAIENAGLVDVSLLTAKVGNNSPSIPTTTMDQILSESQPADASLDSLQSEGIAKILFTSGSTGTPRGVITTHRMMVSNQQALAVIWPFLNESPPVLLDWLPWSHTFGGSFCFNMVLRNGGTMHIDDGAPTPDGFGRTIKNLQSVSPSLYFNVPSAYAMLADVLAKDREFATSFFSQLRLLFFAAAALPPATRRKLEAVAAELGQEQIFFASAWGSTETAPASTVVHFATMTPANIGLPIPGVELKIAKFRDKQEIRVRGANLSPGYWTGPGKVIEPLALDDEGFFRSGDAVEWVDLAKPQLGLLFAGRLGENFKLTSGTWVAVGKVRVQVLDFCVGWVRDVVVAGENRSYLSLLIFPGSNWDDDDIPRSRATLVHVLRQYSDKFPQNSTRIRRALIQVEPPQLDRGETTDKGYINQRRVLELRAAQVERLYAEPPDREVLQIDEL